MKISQSPWSSIPQVGAGENPSSACGHGWWPPHPSLATPGSALALEQLCTRTYMDNPASHSSSATPALPRGAPLVHPRAWCTPWTSPPSGGWMREGLTVEHSGLGYCRVPALYVHLPLTLQNPHSGGRCAAGEGPREVL